MRVREENQRRSIAMAQLKVDISDFQREHDLTTWEIISALAAWIEMAMKYAIRSDRGQDD
jgi:hypothetical protein